MGRLFVYLAIVASVLGIVVLMPGPGSDTVEATHSASTLLPALLPVGGGWVVGLMMGIALAWVARMDWRSIPARIALWIRTLRHRVWWMVCGGVCASVLLFF